jgi:hypothetical protein
VFAALPDGIPDPPLCRRAIVIAWSPSAAGLIGALSAFLEQAIAA